MNQKKTAKQTEEETKNVPRDDKDPWDNPEEKTMAQGFNPLEEDKPADSLDKENTYRLALISEILEAPPIEWLIEDILFDRTFSILGGYTGYGKSLLALAIAQSIAEGSPLFGRYNVNRSGKVLIVDEENSHSDLKDRILRMGIKKELPIYFLSFQGIQLDEPESFDRLFETIIQLQPVLVIFDSLVRFHGKNENDASEMSRVMSHFREITNTGIGCLVLHHHNKGMGPLEIRTRGSSDIVGICDVEYALWKQGNDLNLSTVKTRRTHIESIKLSIESFQDDLKIRCLGTAEDEKAMIEMIVDDRLKEQPSGISEISDFLTNNGNRISDKKLRDLVSEMCEKGYLKVHTGAHRKQTFSSFSGEKLE